MTKPSTLALIHGFTGAPELFQSFRAAMPKGRRVISVPLPFHGPAPYGLDSEAEDKAESKFEAAVDALAEHLRQAQAQSAIDAGDADTASAPLDLFAYSMGARMGVGLLLRHPTLFRSAILIGARPGLPAGPERWARAQWEMRFCNILRHQGLPAFVETWESLPIFAAQSAEQREAQRGLRLQHDAEQLACGLEAMGLAAMPDYRRALATLQTPTLLVAGERDPKFVRAAYAMAAKMPAAEVEVMAGLSHNPLIESPAACVQLLSQAERLISACEAGEARQVDSAPPRVAQRS